MRIFRWRRGSAFILFLFLFIHTHLFHFLFPFLLFTFIVRRNHKQSLVCLLLVEICLLEHLENCPFLVLRQHCTQVLKNFLMVHWGLRWRTRHLSSLFSAFFHRLISGHTSLLMLLMLFMFFAFLSLVLIFVDFLVFLRDDLIVKSEFFIIHNCTLYNIETTL